MLGSAGTYPYLRGALDGSGGQFPFSAIEVDATVGRLRVVKNAGELAIDAIGVRHGVVPALAYRVSVAGRTLLFAGDQDARDDVFWKAARGIDVLIAHAAIADASDSVAARLHATPERLAAGAAEAGVPRVVLAHWMERSRAGVARVRSMFASRYDGAVIEAHDHLCVPLPLNANR